MHNCNDDAVCLDITEGFNCRCRPGYSGDGVSCSACPPNTHSAGGGTTPCSACAKGTYSHAAAVSCIDCVGANGVGTVHDESVETCTACTAYTAGCAVSTITLKLKQSQGVSWTITGNGVSCSGEDYRLEQEWQNVDALCCMPAGNYIIECLEFHGSSINIQGTIYCYNTTQSMQTVAVTVAASTGTHSNQRGTPMPTCHLVPHCQTEGLHAVHRVCRHVIEAHHTNCTATPRNATPL